MVPVEHGGYCIGDDGALWAARGDFGLERFDGQTWQPADTAEIKITPHVLIPARNGWVFAYIGHRISDLKITHGRSSATCSDRNTSCSTATRSSVSSRRRNGS